MVVVAQLRWGGQESGRGPSTPHPSGAPSTHLVLRLVQHKPAGLPGLHEGTFLVQGALVGPVLAAGPARPPQGPAPVPSAPLPGPAAKPRRSPRSQPEPRALVPRQAHEGLARASGQQHPTHSRSQQLGRSLMTVASGPWAQKGGAARGAHANPSRPFSLWLRSPAPCPKG